MIELIMFIIIVGVGVAGILTVMQVTVKASADPVLRKQAIAMAEAVLEEVMAKDYGSTVGVAPSQSGNCSLRTTYSTVDDYNCFDGSAAATRILGSQMLSSTTSPLPDTYWATVVVATTTLSGVTMKLVTVTVTDPSAATYLLTGYKGNY